MSEMNSNQPDLKPATYLPGRTTVWNSSWSRLYEHFGGVIVAYARRQGLNEHSAQDVLQEVMVVLIRAEHGQAAGFDPNKGGFQRWLWGVIHNRMRSVRRVDRKQEPIDPQTECEREDAGRAGALPVATEPAPAGAEADGKDWEQAILEAALEKVRASAPAEKFAIFTALLQEESSPEELAKRYGITRNNVDAIKHRYRNKVIEEARAIRAEWERL
jgi:RNA polymerase sigma factor (sigma-70 family)